MRCARCLPRLMNLPEQRTGDRTDNPRRQPWMNVASASCARHRSPSRAGPGRDGRRPARTRTCMYWQAFPPGGESDLSARHQQVVLKKKCPAVDTIIQYKAGAGGGADVDADEHAAGRRRSTSSASTCRTSCSSRSKARCSTRPQDITPVFWFHYTPDTWWCPSRARSRPSPTSSRRPRPTRAS